MILNWPVRCVLALLMAAMVSTMFLDETAAAAVMTISTVIGLATASRLFIVRSRGLPPNERHAWTLFGAGTGIAAGGLISFVIAWSISNDVAVFGPIDTIWLVGYALVLGGLARLPHAAGSNWQRIRLFIDGVIGAIAVGALLWNLTIRDLTTRLGEIELVQGIVASAFVLLDTAALVVLMIVLVRRSTYRFDPRLVLIATAVVAQGFADYSFLTSGVGRSFTDAEPLYPMSVLAVTMFVAAGAMVGRQAEEYEYADQNKTPWWVLIVPYGFAAALVVVMLLRFPVDPLTNGSGGLLYATVVVFALVIARQAVSIRENQRLVEDQRTALVSSISHELRTPLTSVVGFLDLLDGDSLANDDERREITTVVNHQAQYLGRIVTDLIMLASGVITSMELEVKATPVDSLVWSAVNTAALDPSVVRVETDRHVTAYLDQGRMEQAIASLLGNATRYGGEKVTVIARQHAGDLTVEVHDDGPGVPRKYELMIWEKFERGHNRLNATVPGSGIGLAVTNAIAKAHGGSAGYRRSERLGGACFWIRLPGRANEDRPTTSDAGTTFSVVEDNAQSA
ncbi:MAG: HAMP domain-containing histidine kinase [bacterium]|nr:HAMP domain-containing histidine kinase [bacterium]